MPIIHAPLNDDDFVDLSNMAREKGMTRSALASFILIAEIRKAAKANESEFTHAALRDAVKFNAQGLPLAKQLKTNTWINSEPSIPQYERQ